MAASKFEEEEEEDDKPELAPAFTYLREEKHGLHVSNVFITRCELRNIVLNNCIIEDCHMTFCIIRNCLVTAGPWGRTRHCKFFDSDIRGTNVDSLVLLDARIDNCNLMEGWNDYKLIRDRVAKDPAALKMMPYEPFTNVLLKEEVVDLLRKWAWRTKRRLKAQEKLEQEMETGDTRGMRKDSKAEEDNGEVFKENDNEDNIGPVWSAKKAGKRRFHTCDRYFAEQQLDLPLRRMYMWDQGSILPPSRESTVWKFNKQKGLYWKPLAT